MSRRPIPKGKLPARVAMQPLEPRRLLSALFPAQQFAVANINFTGVDVHLADMTGDGVPDLVTVSSGGVNGQLTLAAGNGDGTYQPHAAVAPGITNLSSGVIGDFTGDGIADAAVANSLSSASIRIVPGTGAGLGTPLATGLPTGNATRRLIAADLTGNGLLDLAAANSGSGNVSVLLQTSPGTFAPAVNYPAGTQSYSVAAGDFDNDGRTDLVVANSGANTVSYLRNLGGGVFAAPVDFGVTTQPRYIVVGNFDGNGAQDVAVASFDSFNISVLLGNGAGSFAAPVNYSPEGNARNLYLNDVNADGKPDLVVVLSSGQVAVMRGTGTGTFLPAVRYLTGASAVAGATGDVNGDGNIDVVTVSSSQRYATVGLGNGDGTFKSPTVGNSGSSPIAIALADANNDGKLDLAIANESLSVVTLLYGDGTGAFPTGTGLTMSTNLRDVKLVDLNNDGRLDVIVAASGSQRVSVRLANTTGGFNANVPYIVNGGPGGVIVGDFTGDGFADIVSVNRSNNSTTGQPSWGAAFLRNNGSGGFLAAMEIAVPVGSTGGVAGDFNNDGKLDFAIDSRGVSGDANVRVLYGNGDGTFAAAVPHPVGFETNGIAAGDFNGDGWIDLALAARSITAPPLIVLRNNGAGAFLPAEQYPMPVLLTQARSVVAADVNGDAKLDLVIGADDNGAIIFRGVGDGTFVGPERYLALGNSYVAAGDINGDGRVDLVAAGFFNAQLTFLLNTAAPDTTPPTVTAAGINIETAQRVSITFNEAIDPATVAPADLIATRLATGQTFSPASVAMSLGNRVLTFTFNGLPDGNYRFRVPGGAVADPSGNALTALYDFETTATFILAGDANRDRSVNIADFSILAGRFNQTGTFSQGDFNYSGTVEIGDFAILAGRFNTSLPAARAAAGAGLAGSGVVRRDVWRVGRVIELTEAAPG